MKYTKVDSSMIDLVGYNPSGQLLEVRFIGSGQKYRYFEVPIKVYQALLKADSKGKFMNAHIIDQYDFVKV